MQVQESTSSRGGFGWKHLFAVAGLAMAVTLGLAFAWYQYYLNASYFEPTRLTPPEQVVLDQKLDLLDVASGGTLEQRFGRGQGRDVAARGLVSAGVSEEAGRLEPEPYTEEGASRLIELTERELNALVARDEQVARRVAIDLADDLVSVKLLLPMDDEFPVIGGRTLRLNLGVNLGYTSAGPVVALSGVSLGGVPLPNAWLGNIKHVNLVDEFGSEGGFWNLFAQGVEDIRIAEGELRVKLKE